MIQTSNSGNASWPAVETCVGAISPVGLLTTDVVGHTHADKP